jgi:cell division control protein 6
MFLEFTFAERPETILDTLREGMRIDQVSDEEVEAVVNTQLQSET